MERIIMHEAPIQWRWVVIPATCLVVVSVLLIYYHLGSRDSWWGSHGNEDVDVVSVACSTLRALSQKSGDWRDGKSQECGAATRNWIGHSRLRHIKSFFVTIFRKPQGSAPVVLVSGDIWPYITTCREKASAGGRFVQNVTCCSVKIMSHMLEVPRTLTAEGPERATRCWANFFFLFL